MPTAYFLFLMLIFWIRVTLFCLPGKSEHFSQVLHQTTCPVCKSCIRLTPVIWLSESKVKDKENILFRDEYVYCSVLSLLIMEIWSRYVEM